MSVCKIFPSASLDAVRKSGKIFFSNSLAQANEHASIVSVPFGAAYTDNCCRSLTIPSSVGNGLIVVILTKPHCHRPCWNLYNSLSFGQITCTCMSLKTQDALRNIKGTSYLVGDCEIYNETETTRDVLNAYR